MSKESVMAALRKAREAREGNIFGGTGQAEFNKNFYAGRVTKTDGVSKPTVTSRWTRRHLTPASMRGNHD